MRYAFNLSHNVARIGSDIDVLFGEVVDIGNRAVDLVDSDSLLVDRLANLVNALHENINVRANLGKGFLDFVGEFSYFVRNDREASTGLARARGAPDA